MHIKLIFDESIKVLYFYNKNYFQVSTYGSLKMYINTKFYYNNKETTK